MTTSPTEDIIQLQDKHYIQASSNLLDDRTRVLKEGDTFAIFNRYGDVHPYRLGDQGIFHSGTRYLSLLELTLNGFRPFLLSSSILEDNTMLAVDLTNPDVYTDNVLEIPRGTLHIFRSKFLWAGTCYERLRISNYAPKTLATKLSFRIGNDFADIFEVRGTKRAKRGQMLEPLITDKGMQLIYMGLDDLERRTTIEWSSPPSEVKASKITFSIELAPQTTQTLFLTYGCRPRNHSFPTLTYDEAVREADADHRRARGDECAVTTSNEELNDWLKRSYEDIHMMTTKLPQGDYPYAGVPWYSTVFGRDGLITGLFTLWTHPSLSRGILAFLAAHQGTEVNRETEEQPGKILHETRGGEMAALKEIPFGFYYGSVDSTPLFIVLAGAYYERTGDIGFIQTIWQNIERALAWIEDHGDIDGDGFIEYERFSENGLVNQGWKDSSDSVFHADGSLAKGPIALCEVQAYVYSAYIHASRMASALGYFELSRSLTLKATDFRVKFLQAFWCDDISMYALALDGEKRQCRVRTSNAAQCLFSGIATQDHADRIAHAMLEPEFYTGWGIRTVASTEAAYNPMSYHNGSVWPHDNAIIGMGLAHYQCKELTLELLKGFFDASIFMELHRLPELFCGFTRRRGIGPTLYPVACSPQAWACASVFSFLQTSLGLKIHGADRKIYFDHPVLPESIGEIYIKNLTVGQSRVSLVLKRLQNDVGLHITDRQGPVEIILIK